MLCAINKEQVKIVQFYFKPNTFIELTMLLILCNTYT